jgi:hypothetical protein
MNNIELIKIDHDMDKYINKINDIMASIEDQDIKDIIVIDYIEKISALALGVDNLCNFFKCLSLINK